MDTHKGPRFLENKCKLPVETTERIDYDEKRFFLVNFINRFDMPQRKIKVEKLMLILAGLLILPCLLLAQEQASNPYKPKLAPHLIPGYTHYMIAISERGKDIVNLQSQGASSSILSTPGSAKRRRSPHVFLPDGTLNYRYLKSKIKYGAGPQG